VSQAGSGCPASDTLEVPSVSAKNAAEEREWIGFAIVADSSGTQPALQTATAKPWSASPSSMGCWCNKEAGPGPKNRLAGTLVFPTINMAQQPLRRAATVPSDGGT